MCLDPRSIRWGFLSPLKIQHLISQDFHTSRFIFLSRLDTELEYVKRGQHPTLIMYLKVETSKSGQNKLVFIFRIVPKHMYRTMYDVIFTDMF